MTARLNTAFQALFGAKELGLTQRFDSAPAKGADDTWVFIYGGSSGVGQFGIQLAKLSGYKVVTVASPRNHEFVKGLGADAVFDVCTFTPRPVFSILVTDAARVCLRSTETPT
jgi:NADPH:quinone reductase-like Zn-dependent oxidoreductase